MNRRHATRPHYRQSAEKDHGILLAMTFIVGCLVGATVTMGLLL